MKSKCLADINCGRSLSVSLFKRLCFYSFIPKQSIGLDRLVKLTLKILAVLDSLSIRAACPNHLRRRTRGKSGTLFEFAPPTEVRSRAGDVAVLGVADAEHVARASVLPRFEALSFGFRKSPWFRAVGESRYCSHLEDFELVPELWKLYTDKM